MKSLHLAASAASVVIALSWTGAARAQETTVVTQPVVAEPAPAAEHVGYVGPNRALLTSGLVLFGVSYTPSVIVAAESNQRADHHLYIPLVGPWIDLGDRPRCGLGSIGCDTETTNKVLLVTDGIFQSIGVVATAISFLMPERIEVITNTAKDDDKPSVHVTPSKVGSSGYGLTAFGNF